MKMDFNGNFVCENQPVFLARNRGYNYGDGLFETLRVINGKIIFWEDHYSRLTSGMKLLQMKFPDFWSKDYLQSRILDLIDQNNLIDHSARVKINVHRDSQGLYKPIDHKMCYLIRTSTSTHSAYVRNPGEYCVGVFKNHRIAPGVLSTLKSTNRLINVLGSIYAEKHEFDNCFLLNDKENPVEALNGNLFMVKDGYIKTPALSEGSLNGITRKKIIEMVGQTDYQIQEESISLSDLGSADEIWVTNVIMGIQPVTRYSDKSYGYEVADKLINLLNHIAKKEAEQG